MWANGRQCLSSLSGASHTSTLDLIWNTHPNLYLAPGPDIYEKHDSRSSGSSWAGTVWTQRPNMLSFPVFPLDFSPDFFFAWVSFRSFTGFSAVSSSVCRACTWKEGLNRFTFSQVHIGGGARLSCGSLFDTPQRWGVLGFLLVDASGRAV